MLVLDEAILLQLHFLGAVAYGIVKFAKNLRLALQRYYPHRPLYMPRVQTEMATSTAMLVTVRETLQQTKLFRLLFLYTQLQRRIDLSLTQ